MKINEIAKEIKIWQEHNFKFHEADDPLIGMMEELGEISHHYLKQKQNIRINEDHITGLKDSIGDFLIYLIDFCNCIEDDYSMHIDPFDILYEVWQEVKKRDWIKFPKNGMTE